MTPALLERAGVLLEGPDWKSQLARDLGVNVRTVQRWATGVSPIPRRVPRELAQLLVGKCDEVTQLVRELVTL